MNTGTITERPAATVGHDGARRSRAMAWVAALVDWGAWNLELFDGFTMKTPELLGSG